MTIKRIIRVPAKDLGKRERQLAAHYKQDIIDAMDQSKSQIKALLHEESNVARTRLDGTKQRAVATGTFRDSWRVKVLPSNLSVTILNDAPYSDYVEEGRRPGKRPPKAKILAWVEQKLGYSGSMASTVAFFISRKIARSGWAGYGFFGAGRKANKAAKTALADRIQTIIRNNVLRRLKRRM